MIDPGIITACKKGKRKAQYDLYQYFYTAFMNVCRRYQPDDQQAEDVLNQAFFKVLKNLPVYSEEHAFGAWCRRIVINTNIDFFRASRKVKELIEYKDHLLESDVNYDLSFDTRHYEFEAEELQAMIKTLPPVTQKVFNLFAIDDYSHRDISEMLGMSVGTSKWHLSSARKKLKAMIETELKKRKFISYGK